MIVSGFFFNYPLKTARSHMIHAKQSEGEQSDLFVPRIVTATPPKIAETIACGDLKIRMAHRVVPPSDNEFYCSTMTRERFPFIFRNHSAVTFRLQQILLQIL